MKFPKPWRLEQTDPGCVFAVIDAGGRKLFFVCEDDNPDGEGDSGDLDGRTVLGDNDEDTGALLDELIEIFARQP